MRNNNNQMNFWEFLDRNSDGIGGFIVMAIMLGF